MVYFNQVLYTIRLDPITKDNDLRLNILKSRIYFIRMMSS